MPLLPPESLVFVNDNKSESGKGVDIREFMKKIGAKQICEEYQIDFTLPSGRL